MIDQLVYNYFVIVAVRPWRGSKIQLPKSAQQTIITPCSHKESQPLLLVNSWRDDGDVHFRAPMVLKHINVVYLWYIFLSSFTQRSVLRRSVVDRHESGDFLGTFVFSCTRWLKHTPRGVSQRSGLWLHQQAWCFISSAVIRERALQKNCTASFPFNFAVCVAC